MFRMNGPKNCSCIFGTTAIPGGRMLRAHGRPTGMWEVSRSARSGVDYYSHNFFLTRGSGLLDFCASNAYDSATIYFSLKDPYLLLEELV